MTDDQNLTVIFNRGLSYKSDPNTQIVAIPTRLENLVFDEDSTVRVRDGYTAISGATALNAKQMATRALEVLFEDGNGLSVLAANGLNVKNDYWQAADPQYDAVWERATCQIENIVAPGQTQILECDHASMTGYECFAWSELVTSASFTLRAVVRDTTTGTIVAQGVLDTASNLTALPHPRVIAAGTKFFVYWNRAATPALMISSIDTSSTLTFAAASGALAFSTSAQSSFDALLGASGMDITLGVVDNAGQVRIGAVSSADGKTVVRSFVNTTIGADGSLSVCQLVASISGRTVDVVAFTDNGTSTLYVTKLDNGVINTFSRGSLTGLGLVTVIDSTPFTGDTSGSVRVFYELNPGYDASEAWPVDIREAALTMLGVPADTLNPDNTVAKGVCLAGRPVYTGPTHFSSFKNIYLPVAQAHGPDPAVQPTVFLLALPEALSSSVTSHPASVVTSKILPGESGFVPSSQGNSNYLRYRLPTCIPDSTGNVINLASLRNGKILLSGGAAYWAQIVSIARVDLLGTQSNVETGGSVFLAGGCPHLYDGQQVHEAGFNMFPEFPTGYTPTQATGGSLTVGTTYGVCFLFEWTDATGRLHRSAPSVPISVLLTGSNNKLTFKVSYLRLTRKYNVRIACYRTTGNGSVYFRDTSTGLDASNKPNTNGILSFVCTASDAALQSNEILYTTGGALSNQAFPSASRACLHQRRVFMSLDSDPNMIWYSDELDDQTDAQATNPVYQLPVPVTHGKICWLDSMDDKLVICCERGVFVVFGSGPDRLGNQNSYTLPQAVVNGFGGRFGHPNAHIVTPDGIWFLTGINGQSDNGDGVEGQQGPGGGLRLLGRNLMMAQNQHGYLGAEVDKVIAFNYFGGSFNFGGKAVRAIKRPGKAQYYFLLGSQGAVVYDQQWGAWSSYTHFSFQDIAASADSIICAPTDNTALMKHNGNSVTDNGSNAAIGVLETGWLMPGSILHGFQRVKRLQVTLNQPLLGDGGPSILIKCAFDDQDFSESTSLISSSNPPVDLEHHVIQQKCRAFKVQITLAKNAASKNVGGLTGMTIRVGMKKGLKKIPSSQRA